MIRYGNLYEKIISKESLFDAYLQARRGKRSRHACHSFERRIGYQIDRLHRQLSSGQYEPHECNPFYIFEPKKRLIEAPAFADLVVQHAVYAVVMPIFDRTFARNSFACRRGFGTHKAADYLQDHIGAATRGSWVLKMDCRKFFYSIDRDILSSLLSKKIKCARTHELMMKFARRKEPKGVAIGNLMSQMFALIYMNPIDQYIKRELKIKSYARYVDDLVMFLPNRDKAQEAHQNIENYLHEKLNLRLSKSSISPISKGVNAFGFRTWASGRFIRKRSLYVASKAMKKNRLEAVVSCLGHARKTKSFQHLLSLAQEQNHGLYLRLPKSFRSIHHLHADSAD